MGGLSDLLPLMAMGGGGFAGGQTDCSSGNGTPPADFAAFFTANIGYRVKLQLFLQTMFLFTAPQEITARVVNVGSDYVTLDRFCLNGTPILDPRILTVMFSIIVGAQRLTRRDEFVHAACALG